VIFLSIENQFRSPKISSGFRKRSTPAPFVHVPETTMHKNHLLPSRKGCNMKTIAEPRLVKHSPDNHLRAGVRRTDPRHNVATLRGSNRVDHNLVLEARASSLSSFTVLFDVSLGRSLKCKGKTHKPDYFHRSDLHSKPAHQRYLTIDDTATTQYSRASVEWISLAALDSPCL
jgi:hypothetical protein